METELEIVQSSLEDDNLDVRNEELQNTNAELQKEYKEMKTKLEAALVDLDIICKDRQKAYITLEHELIKLRMKISGDLDIISKAPARMNIHDMKDGCLNFQEALIELDKTIITEGCDSKDIYDATKTLTCAIEDMLIRYTVFADKVLTAGEPSGITVSTAAKTAYKEVDKDKKYRYIIYHIKDEKVIDVELTGPREATYSEFLEQLQTYKNECRYCVFDFPTNIPVDDGQEKSISVDRLVLITWCPRSSTIKQKILYCSNYDSLKEALVGIYKYVKACNFEEASQEAIEDAIRKDK